MMQGWPVVSGRKIWTPKALESEAVLLLARTDDVPEGAAMARSAGWFVPRGARSEVLDIRPIPKLGRNVAAPCEVAHDELPVEGWRLVGERGRGFHIFFMGLTPSDLLRPCRAALVRSLYSGR